MSAIWDFMNSGFCHHLALALLQTLWIGVAVALALWAALRRIDSRRPELRYGLAALSLLAIMLGGLVSLAILEHAPINRQAADATQDAANASAGGSSTSSSNSIPPIQQLGIAEHSANAISASNGIISGESMTPISIANTPFMIPQSWTSWLTALWLAGAAIMLLRVVCAVALVGRVRRSCRPIADATLKAAADELRVAMKVARRVGMLVSDEILVPCVVGIVWPAIVIPGALLTGLCPDDLRAILAHELAHIRRHDALVNILQMLIEALLFFNPAVWWVSRQMRLEREACCDAQAAAICGEGVSYARTLVEFAARRSSFANDPITPERLSAPAFGDPQRPSSLLERVRRLTLPSYRPALRLPWHSLALLLLLSALALACFKKGADKAVVIVEKIMSPQERIERMQKIEKQYEEIPKGDYGEKDNITLAGRIVNEDGKPPTGYVSFNISSNRPGSGYNMSAQANPDGTFSIKIEYGVINFSCKAPGYATAWRGPIKTQPGGTIKDIVITLKRGFKGQVKVVNPQGEPIAGTKFTGYYNTPTSSHSYQWEDRNSLVADAQGLATVDDASTIPLLLTAKAPGFEETQWKDIHLIPDHVTTLTMQPALPTEGVVVAADGGKPVAGAQFHLVRQLGGLESGWGPDSGPIIATSDAKGMFRVDNLREDTKYYLFVEAPGFRREIINFTAGQKDLKIEMKPRLYVQGKVLGPEFAKKEKDKPVIDYNQSFKCPDHTDCGSPKQVELQIRDGIGYFEFDKLWAGEVSISAGNSRKTLTLSEPVKDLTFDLKSEAATKPMAQREVIIRFEVPAGSPPPTGKIKVYYDKTPEEQSMTFWPAIENGQVRLTIPVPNTLRYESEQMIGYWFAESEALKVPVDTKPFEVKVPVIPAGSIYGRILEKDGQPATQAMASVVVVKRPPELEGKSMSLNFDNNDSDNKFNLSPLPLGGTYAVVAHRGHTYVMSPVMNLTEKEPLRQVELTLPEGIPLRGRVMDETGNPLEGMTVQCDYNTSYTGFGTNGIPTAKDGTFVFEHVNPDAPGKYELKIKAPGWQPARQVATLDGKLMEIRLQRGLVITGRVIDDETSQPLSNVEVYAMPQQAYRYEDHQVISWMGWSDAVEPTDAEGRFRFNQLGNRPYSMGCRSGQIIAPKGEVLATGGQAAPVELRIKLSDWEKKRRSKTVK